MGHGTTVQSAGQLPVRVHHTFSQAVETTPCPIKLAEAITGKVLDRRYVTDQRSSVVSGPLQARPILIQAQATLISLPSNHTEERRIRKQEGSVHIGTTQMSRDLPRPRGTRDNAGSRLRRLSYA